MDDLTTLMRAAVDAPPPTQIELDRLIAGEQRRRRTLAWTGVGTGAAVAVAAILVAPAVLTAGPDSPPFGAPTSMAPAPTDTASVPATPTTAPTLCAIPGLTGAKPPRQAHGIGNTRPTEPPAQAVPRLTVALQNALRDKLPPGVRAEGRMRPDCAHPQFEPYLNRGDEYVALMRITGERGAAYLQVRLLPTASDDDGSCQAADAGGTCQSLTHPDGTTGTLHEERTKGGDRQISVLLRRPDGTSILLTASNNPGALATGQGEVTGQELPVTGAELVSLGLQPGLTLYP